MLREVSYTNSYGWKDILHLFLDLWHTHMLVAFAVAGLPFDAASISLTVDGRICAISYNTAVDLDGR